MTLKLVSPSTFGKTMTWCLYWTCHHVLFSHKTWRGICPKDLNLVHQLCLTKNKCDISLFLFSFSVMYLWRELGFVCPLIRIACSIGTFLSMSFLTDACVRLWLSVLWFHVLVILRFWPCFSKYCSFCVYLPVHVKTIAHHFLGLLCSSHHQDKWDQLICKNHSISITIFFIRGNEIYFRVVS
jgi:hypothetical protein